MAITRVTFACRLVCLCLATWVCLASQRANAFLQSVWDAMRQSAWVQHETFEPLLVVATFSVSIFTFFLMDIPLGHWTKQWRSPINGSPDMSAWQWEGGKRVLQEGAWYIIPLACFDILYPRRQLPAMAPGAIRLTTEVVVALLLYDALFTVGHVACHKLPWLYHMAHAKHHRCKTVRACETICLTPFEEALDVACSIAALNIIQAHPMSRCVYNVLIVYLLTELHSGYELPWMLQDVVPGGLWAGSRMHALHHRTGTMCYQKFFTYLDAAMGSLPKQAGSAHSSMLLNQS